MYCTHLYKHTKIVIRGGPTLLSNDRRFFNVPNYRLLLLTIQYNLQHTFPTLVSRIILFFFLILRVFPETAAARGVRVQGYFLYSLITSESVTPNQLHWLSKQNTVFGMLSVWYAILYILDLSRRFMRFWNYMYPLVFVECIKIFFFF